MEDNEVLVKVEHLSKKFCKDLKTSLWYGVKDLYANILGNKEERSLRPDEFWAVKDINFELRRGECLGLIGHNGAGKSTLLKILNGLINPDEGKVTIKGRVGALIELGAGFNPILSGRENIYNNGAVLGFSKKEIDGKVEEIIDFAEIREFIDMPVQNYSSGMKVRLGFAVAAQMEPDVLIIDEVLAVGDVGFRGKCYEAIDKMSQKCAIIFVSHSMPMISKICSNAILMTSGQMEFNGRPPIAIEKYYDHFPTKLNHQVILHDDLKIKNITVDQIVEIHNPFSLEIILECKREFKGIELNFVLLSRELIPAGQFNSKFQGCLFDLKAGINKIEVTVDSIDLNPGIYVLSVSIEDSKDRTTLLWNHGVKEIKIKSNSVNFGNAPYLINAKWKY
jgi:lipopolysaccharide transport system ATP-binding protein